MYEPEPRKQDPLNQHEPNTYELRENDAVCTRPTQICTNWRPKDEIRSIHMFPFITQNQSPINDLAEENLA